MGGQGDVQRSSNRPEHHSEARPGHIKVGGAARLSARSAGTPGSPRKLRCKCGCARRASVQWEGHLRVLSPRTHVYRRRDRPRIRPPLFFTIRQPSGPNPSMPPRSGTGQYRATPLRGAWSHPPYFHDGKRSRSVGRSQPLRPRARAETVTVTESGSRRVPEITLTDP